MASISALKIKIKKNAKEFYAAIKTGGNRFSKTPSVSTVDKIFMACCLSLLQAPTPTESPENTE